MRRDITISALLNSRLAVAIIGAGLIFVVYLGTLQLTINGSQHPYTTDVGEIQNALPRWGTIHFPGYPLYSLTGSAFVSVVRLLGRVSPHRYRCRFGAVLRAGRVVEVIRPVAITLKEILNDPPCRVSLTLRWRIDPGLAGCTVRLRAQYLLNHAALLRARHWDERLARHFRNQSRFLAVNLDRSRNDSQLP